MFGINSSTGQLTPLSPESVAAAPSNTSSVYSLVAYGSNVYMDLESTSGSGAVAEYRLSR